VTAQDPASPHDAFAGVHQRQAVQRQCGPASSGARDELQAHDTDRDHRPGVRTVDEIVAYAYREGLVGGPTRR
jgi:hypothetical protein